MKKRRGDKKFIHTITSHPIENEYPKLVRDRIPEIIKREDRRNVREILDELQKLKGFSNDQVRRVQDEKREKRGGFSKRLLMLNNDG